MKSMVAAAAAALFACQFITASSVSAESLTWNFRNDHPNIVSVELYADDGVWPGNGQVYTLDDSAAKEINISCSAGERVCYGAWVRNTESTSWGAGRGGEGACERCCYICDGGETPVLVLD